MPYPLRSRGYFPGGKQLKTIKVSVDLDAGGSWSFESDASKQVDSNALTLENWYTGSVMTRRGTILPQLYKVYTIEETGEVGIFVDAVLYVVSSTYDRFLSDGITKPLEQCERYDFYQILDRRRSGSLGHLRKLPQGEHKLRYTDTTGTSSTSPISSHIDSSRIPKDAFTLLKKVRRGTDTSVGRTRSNTPISVKECAEDLPSSTQTPDSIQGSSCSSDSAVIFKKRHRGDNTEAVEFTRKNKDTSSREYGRNGHSWSTIPPRTDCSGPQTSGAKLTKELRSRKNTSADCLKSNPLKDCNTNGLHSNSNSNTTHETPRRYQENSTKSQCARTDTLIPMQTRTKDGQFPFVTTYSRLPKIEGRSMKTDTSSEYTRADPHESSKKRSSNPSSSHETPARSSMEFSRIHKSTGCGWLKREHSTIRRVDKEKPNRKTTPGVYMLRTCECERN